MPLRKAFSAAGALLGLALWLSGCGSDRVSVGHYKVGSPYRINGKWYYPEYDPSYSRRGVASWYGDAFDGLPTANGETFDPDGITAAHPTLPLPSRVRVVNLANGRSVVVRVNDRGPFVDDRLIDLSQAAAQELGFEDDGLASVQVTFLGLADATGTPPTPRVTRLARASTRQHRYRAAPDPAQARTPPARTRTLVVAQACRPAPSYVQLGAFADSSRAAAALAAAGPGVPTHTSTVRVSGRPLVRVQAGPFGQKSQATALLGRMRAMGYEEASLSDAGRAARC